jgi:hypothetical protein
MQSKLEEKINGLEELSNRTAFLWQNIKSHTEIAEIITVQSCPNYPVRRKIYKRYFGGAIAFT